jgi:DNA-binding XRE family transcriptional regulator
MIHQVTRNHLRRHRKQSGLSQREIGALLGYRKQWQVSRHERSETLPPLLIALAYQVIFQAPVSVIFVGMHGAALKMVERNLAAFEQNLTSGGTRQSARAIAQKLKWLKDRRK